MAAVAPATVPACDHGSRTAAQASVCKGAPPCCSSETSQCVVRIDLIAAKGWSWDSGGRLNASILAPLSKSKPIFRTIICLQSARKTLLQKDLSHLFDHFLCAAAPPRCSATRSRRGCWRSGPKLPSIGSRSSRQLLFVQSWRWPTQ